MRGASANFASDPRFRFGRYCLRLAKSLDPKYVPKDFKWITEKRIKRLGYSVGFIYPWNRLRPIESILGRRFPRRVKSVGSYVSFFPTKVSLSSGRLARHFLVGFLGSKLIPQLFATRRSNRLHWFFDKSAYPMHRYGNGLNSDFYSPLAHSFYRPFFRFGFLSSWKPPIQLSVPSVFSPSSYFFSSRTHRLSYLYLHRRFLNFKLLGESFFRFNFPRPNKLGFEIWRRRRNLFTSFVPPFGGSPFFRSTVGTTGLIGPAKRSIEAPRQVAIRLYQWLSKRFMRRYIRPRASFPSLVFRIRSALTARMRSVIFYFFKFIKTLGRIRPDVVSSSLRTQVGATFTAQEKFVFSFRRRIKTKLQKLLAVKPIKNSRKEKRQMRIKAVLPTFFRLSSSFPVLARPIQSARGILRSNYQYKRPVLLKHQTAKMTVGSIFSHGLYVPRRSHGGLVRFPASRRRKNRRRLKTKRRLGFSSALA